MGPMEVWRGREDLDGLRELDKRRQEELLSIPNQRLKTVEEDRTEARADLKREKREKRESFSCWKTFKDERKRFETKTEATEKSQNSKKNKRKEEATLLLKEREEKLENFEKDLENLRLRMQKELEGV